MSGNDVESARTLVLVAIVLEAAFIFLFVFIFLFSTFFLAFVPIVPQGNGNTGATATGLSSGIIVLLSIGLGLGLYGLLWILLDYFLVYKKINEGNLRSAKDSSLVLGIVQLLIGGIIPGILLIVAHTQLGNAVWQKEGHQ